MRRGRRRRVRPWLFREVRRGRAATWRRAWRFLLLPVLVFGLLVALVGLVERHHPFASGFLIGLIVTGAAAVSLVLVWTAEGSLIPRLLRLHESAAFDELRKAPGIYSAHRNVEFSGLDVDCVVIAPAGVFAVEVKAMVRLKAERRLDDWTRDRWATQARLGARKIGLLLHSKGVHVDVHPAVALVGKGVPESQPAYELVDGVRWVVIGEADAWRRKLATGELDKQTADRIDSAIRSYRDRFRPD